MIERKKVKGGLEKREWKERGIEWKGEDRGRKGGIPEIITQENDAKEGHKIIS